MYKCTITHKISFVNTDTPTTTTIRTPTKPITYHQWNTHRERDNQWNQLNQTTNNVDHIPLQGVHHSIDSTASSFQWKQEKKFRWSSQKKKRYLVSRAYIITQKGEFLFSFFLFFSIFGRKLWNYIKIAKRTPTSLSSINNYHLLG